MNHNDVENTIRRELERMGVQQAPDATQDAQEAVQEHAQAPQAPVSVEAALSFAIGGPLAVPVPGLNNDGALAKIIGANTLNGKKL